MSKEAMKLNEIMEQAQVFASAWSIVGGRFDGGNAMDDAELAKSELRQMVAEALAEQPAQQDVSVIDKLVGVYCKAWEQSFTADNPYQTVSMTADDRKHIEAGIKAALEKESLHKLAEKSRTEGLCLDDWGKIVCVNHDCDKCKAEQPAQQEPVALFKWLPKGATHIGRISVRTASGGSLAMTAHVFKYDSAVLKVYVTDNDNEYPGWRDAKDCFFHLSFPVLPLYTSPPQRKPLTDEEIRDALEAEFLGADEKRNWHDDVRVARAIEAAHGITAATQLKEQK